MSLWHTHTHLHAGTHQWSDQSDHSKSMVTSSLFNLDTRSCFSKSGDIIVTMSHAPVYEDAIAAILWCDNPVFSCSRPQSRQHKVMEASCRYNCRADRTVRDLKIPNLCMSKKPLFSGGNKFQYPSDANSHFWKGDRIEHDLLIYRFQLIYLAVKLRRPNTAEW